MREPSAADAALVGEGNAREAALTTPVFVRARVNWARRQGHPDYLWPDIAMVRWRTALRGIEEAVRAVLAGRAIGAHALIAPPRLEAGTAEDVRALGLAAFTSGLGPLLGRWLEEGRVCGAPEAEALLLEHLEHGRRRAVRMAGLARDAVEALVGAGVRPLILKGLHTAGYFPEPGARPAADIDLAVRPAELVAAERALAGAGWRRGGRRGDWQPAEPQAIRSLEMTRADNPVGIDLHAGLARDFHGVRRLDPGPVAFDAARASADVPGARVLAQPWLFVYLAAHASEEFHRLQLLRLVELILVAERDLAGTQARDDVRMLTRELEAGRFLYPAVRLAETLAPGTFDAAWLSELEAAASPRMRRALLGMRPSDAQRLEGLALRDRFLHVHGPVEWVRRLAYLVWPARSRHVGTVYAERIWRLLRGRVSLGSSGIGDR